MEYNAILKEKALETGMGFVDLRAGFDSSAMLGKDGTHPNIKGENFLYSKIMPAILHELGIENPLAQIL